MRANPHAARHALTARLAAFAALAGVVAWQWSRLVADPPAGRIGVALGALLAGTVLIALIGAGGPGRARARVLTAAIALAAGVAGLLAIGVSGELLWPGGWDRLADQVSRGFAGLHGEVEYPYGGGNDWSRKVLLAGLPPTLGLAAALTFWPAGDKPLGSRMLGLSVLLAAYAVAAYAVAPAAPLLWGALLLALVAAWLWLPRLGRSDRVSGSAQVALAAVGGVLAAGALDAERPWIDYSGGDESAATFDWDHSYGPLDWPRTGSTLLAVRSDEARYWRASVLDRFDGTRWLDTWTGASAPLELPSQVADGRRTVDANELKRDWVETVGVSVGSMRSQFVPGPGTVLDVNGLDRDTEGRTDGTTMTGDEPLQDGDSYSAVAYAPDPTPARMRAAPDRYPPILARYTAIWLPLDRRGVSATEVEVPLRGRAGGGDPGAAQRILASPYAELYRRARSLTDGTRNAYQAVTALERHFRGGPYRYAEDLSPAGPYPLASFLTDERAGYCQQFSGAMALMLRMIGIPSRVATGFTPGSPDPEVEDRYLVSDFDAHSWVEVYFNGIGWVPFEPTPAAAPATAQLGEQVAGAGGQTGRQDPPPDRGGAGDLAASRPSSPGGAVWTIIAGALGALAIGGAPAAIRARRYRSLSSGAAADAQLAELGRGLARLGIGIRPGETLLGLEHRLRGHSRPTTANYSARLRAIRFEDGGAGPPTLKDRRAVRRELAAGSGPRGRLRAGLAFPRGAPRR